MIIFLLNELGKEDSEKYGKYWEKKIKNNLQWNKWVKQKL